MRGKTVGQGKRGAWRGMGKVIAALVVAFLALNAFCLFYYTLPAHVPNPDGATDYAWEHGGYFAKANEGYSWGNVDEGGYNNLEGEPEDISVLVMGSSHMEAMQVAPDKNCAHLLGEMMAAGTGGGSQSGGVYNIGISGHTLLVCIDSLASAVDRYDPDGAVVIETATVEFDLDSIEAELDGSRKKVASSGSGIYYSLQRIPLLRLLYAQVEELRGIDDEANVNAAAVTGNADAEMPTDEYIAALDELLSLAKARAGDRELVIFYHPTLTLNRDEGIVVQTKPTYLDVFAQACANNDVVFVDMTDRFLDAYATSSILPHGFSNTSVGAGHLNEDGHRICAETLYETLTGLGVV